jgi:uncharacterized membrane protein HdeD (DUF308 family)
MDDIRRARRWLIILGVLMLIAGALAILVPAAASVTVAIFVGWLLVYAGVLQLIHTFTRERDAKSRALRALHGVLTLAAGIIMVAFPLTGTISLTVVLAAWFFASGAIQLAMWWSERGTPGSGLLAFNGGLSAVLGFLIAVSLPSSAAWAIGLLVGIDLIFWGTRTLMAASLLKAVEPRRHPPSGLQTA